MSCITRMDAIVEAACETKRVRPIVQSTLYRIEKGIDARAIGYALGAWAFCNFPEHLNDRELQDAVMEVTLAAKLSPKESNFLWQRGRAYLLALESVRDVELGSSESDAVGYLWDCHRELYEEVMGRIEFINPGLELAMREERRKAFYRSSDCHWGDES